MTCNIREALSSWLSVPEVMQDAFVRSNAPTELVAAMVRSPERPVALHAAAALHAVTAGHVEGQVALQECGGIQVWHAV